MSDKWSCLSSAENCGVRFKKYFGSGNSEGGACQDCPDLRLNGNKVILIDGKQTELLEENLKEGGK